MIAIFFRGEDFNLHSFAFREIFRVLFPQDIFAIAYPLDACRVSNPFEGRYFYCIVPCKCGVLAFSVLNQLKRERPGFKSVAFWRLRAGEKQKGDY